MYNEKTYVIGIAGASASGKSTVSERLGKLFADYEVRVIHMGEYYREVACRPEIIGITDSVKCIDDNHPAALDLDQCCLDVKAFVDCAPDEWFARRVSRNLSYG